MKKYFTAIRLSFFFALILFYPRALRADVTASLITAVKQDQETTALSLLAQGANPNQADQYGYNATMWAVSRTSPAVLSALLKAGGDIKDVPASFIPIIEAAKSGNAGNIQLLASLGYNANATDTMGNTAIMYASVFGSTAAVQALLNAKANINAQDNHGQSALIKSAQNGNAQMVLFLIANQATINAQDHFGYTALMWAAHNGQMPAVQALLSKSASVTIMGLDGMTALAIAQKRGYPQIVQLIKG